MLMHRNKKSKHILANLNLKLFHWKMKTHGFMHWTKSWLWMKPGWHAQALFRTPMNINLMTGPLRLNLILILILGKMTPKGRKIHLNKPGVVFHPLITNLECSCFRFSHGQWLLLSGYRSRNRRWRWCRFNSNQICWRWNAHFTWH